MGRTVEAVGDESELRLGLGLGVGRIVEAVGDESELGLGVGLGVGRTVEAVGDERECLGASEGVVKRAHECCGLRPRER